MREIVSNVTSKGQVTIPREIRQHLGLGTPDQIAFVIDEVGRVELRPPEYTVEQLQGIIPALPGRETTDFADQIDEAMQEEADRIYRQLEGR